MHVLRGLDSEGPRCEATGEAELAPPKLRAGSVRNRAPVPPGSGPRAPGKALVGGGGAQRRRLRHGVMLGCWRCRCLVVPWDGASSPERREVGVGRGGGSRGSGFTPAGASRRTASYGQNGAFFLLRRCWRGGRPWVRAGRFWTRVTTTRRPSTLRGPVVPTLCLSLGFDPPVPYP